MIFQYLISQRTSYSTAEYRYKRSIACSLCRRHYFRCWLPVGSPPSRMAAATATSASNPVQQWDRQPSATAATAGRAGGSSASWPLVLLLQLLEAQHGDDCCFMTCPSLQCEVCPTVLRMH